MARYKPSPIFESFSGKIGNSVFTSNRAGNCLRNHVIPSNPQTASQVAIRDIFKMIASMWFSLSTSVRSNFTNFANAGYIPLQRDPNTLGYTGRQAFSALATCAQYISDWVVNSIWANPETWNLAGDDLTDINWGTPGIPLDAPALWNASPTFDINGNPATIQDFAVTQDKLQNGTHTYTLDIDFDAIHNEVGAVEWLNGGKPVGFCLYLSNALKAEGASVISPFQKKFLCSHTASQGTSLGQGVSAKLQVVWSCDEGDYTFLSGWYYVSLIMFTDEGQQYVLKQKYIEFSVPT